MNNAHRPIDSKREEFRKYLERTGVLDAITKTLTHLYEEPDKPNDAVSFIYKFMGESFPDKVPQTDNLAKELAEERGKVAKLSKEVEDLKAKVMALEKAEADAEKDEEAMLEETIEPPTQTELVTAQVVESTEEATTMVVPAEAPLPPEQSETAPAETPPEVLTSTTTA